MKVADLTYPYLIVFIMLPIILFEIIFLGFFIKNERFNQSSVSKNTKFETKIFGSRFEELKYWEEIVKEVGGENAYEIFKQRYIREDDLKEVHVSAHIFGEALYRIKGIEGFTACDSSFVFGCLHSFMGSAIHEKGLEVVPILNSECLNNFKDGALGCQHGIGHGILSSMGYDLPDLIKSLGVCGEIQAQNPIDGCWGGVYMEHNLRTLLSDDTKVRYVDARGDYYFPCNALAEKYKNSCYFWLSQWYLSVFDGNLNQRIKKAGESCAELNSVSLKKMCFLGIGNAIVTFTKDDTTSLIAGCDQAGLGEFRDLCKLQAAFVFNINYKEGKGYINICNTVSKSFKELCLDKKYSNPALSILQSDNRQNDL